jgi:hypothetical protein
MKTDIYRQGFLLLTIPAHGQPPRFPMPSLSLTCGELSKQILEKYFRCLYIACFNHFHRFRHDTDHRNCNESYKSHNAFSSNTYEFELIIGFSDRERASRRVRHTPYIDGFL